MEDFEIRQAIAADVPAMVALANQNTYQALSPTDRLSGFLTGTFTEEGVQLWIHSAPCMVAYLQEQLAGFLINSKLASAAYPPLVQQIILMMPKLSYRNLPLLTYNWFFYGPVLVSKEFRGRGLLSSMFYKSKELLQGKFKLGIAFIHKSNTASYAMHTQHLGLETVGILTFQAHIYHILAFPVLDLPQ